MRHPLWQIAVQAVVFAIVIAALVILGRDPNK